LYDNTNSKYKGQRRLELWVVSRVARLGEFSPIGSLFTLGNFVKIAEVAPIIGLLFYTVKVMF
jgi:hypothetical protein